MTNNELTFNDLPQVVAELRDEVSGMKALLQNLQNRSTQQRENRHRPVTPEQVAEYTNIPLATIYQKLASREIPGSKPGKRWVIYLLPSICVVRQKMSIIANEISNTR